MIQIQVILGIIIILIGLIMMIFNKFFAKFFMPVGPDIKGDKAVAAFVVGLLMMILGMIVIILGFLNIRIAGL